MEYHVVRGPQIHIREYLIGHSLEANLSTQRVCRDLDHAAVRNGGRWTRRASRGWSGPGAANNSSLFISGDAVKFSAVRGPGLTACSWSTQRGVARRGASHETEAPKERCGGHILGLMLTGMSECSRVSACGRTWRTHACDTYNKNKKYGRLCKFAAGTRLLVRASWQRFTQQFNLTSRDPAQRRSRV